MRAAAILLLLAALGGPGPAPAFGQGLVLGGSPPPPQDCIAVAAGGSTSAGCIDARQQALTQQHQAAIMGEELGPGSPATRLGLYSHAAVQQQFGTAFGHAAVPQRPPAPVFTSPLDPPHPH